MLQSFFKLLYFIISLSWFFLWLMYVNYNFHMTYYCFLFLTQLLFLIIPFLVNKIHQNKISRWFLGLIKYRKYSRVRKWTVGISGGKELIAIIRASGSISRVKSQLSVSGSGITSEEFIEKIRTVRGTFDIMSFPLKQLSLKHHCYCFSSRGNIILLFTGVTKINEKRRDYTSFEAFDSKNGHTVLFAFQN